MNDIGIDIHQKHCVLSALNEAGERLREARIATNDRAALEEYCRSLGGPCRAVIEACWGWGKVHDMLKGIACIEEVVLAHPSKTRIIAEAQIKTDKVDARALAFRLRLGAVPRAHVPGLVTRRRKEVLRQRLFWGRERTKIRNRTHALLDRQNTELARPVEGESVARGAQDAQFVPTQHDEAARPRCGVLAAEYFQNSPGEREATGLGEAHQEQAVVRSGLEFADVGKIEILRDEKAALPLRRSPNIAVVASRQSFLRHGVRVMVQP